MGNPPIRPRILQVIADSSPGGGTTHVLQLLRRLSPSWQVGLATKRVSYLSRAAHDLVAESLEFDPFGPLALLQAPDQVREVLKAFQPDLIHAHGSRAGFLVALAGPQVPFVYTVHGLHVLRRPPMARWLGSQAERLTNRRAACTIFVSESDHSISLANRLVPPEHAIRVIYNGIPSASTVEKPRPSPRHIGFIGRMEHQKDPLLFVDTMACLPGYTAEMIGGGDLEPQVRAEIEKKGMSSIRLLGTLSHDDVLGLLPTFSVILMTSRWEGLPILPMEAMRAGVPFIATRVAGMGEVIEDGVSGLLVDGRQPKDIANAVRRMSEDVGLRQRVIEAGEKRVRELFSEDRMIRGIEEVYHSVIPASSARA